MSDSTPSSSSSKQRADAIRARARDTYYRFGTTISRELDPAYMQAVGSFPRLTPEEEIHYARQYSTSRQELQRILRQWPLLFLHQLRCLDEDSELRTASYLEIAGREENIEERESLGDQLAQFLHRWRKIPRATANSQDNAAVAPTTQMQDNIFWESLEPLRLRDIFYDACLNTIFDDGLRPSFVSADDWSQQAPVINQLCAAMQEAKGILVERNLRLVISIAGNFLGSGIPLADLVQEGNLGLLRTVEKFDYRLGHRFGTYASYWIRQAITRHLTNHGRVIRMPANTVQQINQINRMEQELLQKNGLLPSMEEIAEELNLAPARVRALRKMSQQPLSLHMIMNEDSTLEDMIADNTTPTPHDVAKQNALQDSISMALDNLDERERMIITMRFGLQGNECHTLAQLSDMMQLSSERIRQIEAVAIKKLRLPQNIQFFEGYH